MNFKFRNNFITGLAVILPFTLTIFILFFIINKLNAFLLDPIMKFFEPIFPGLYLEFLGKLVILLVLVFGVWAIGGLARILILRKAFGFFEKIFLKVPMLSFIYKTIKEMSSAFIGENRAVFNKVVLVEYPRKGVFAIGFVTSELKGEAQQKTNKTLISVFLPTSPNPTSGMFTLFPVEEIIPLEMSVADGMRLIISGGAVQVPYKESTEKSLKTGSAL